MKLAPVRLFSCKHPPNLIYFYFFLQQLFSTLLLLALSSELCALTVSKCFVRSEMLGWARRVEDRPAPQLSGLFSGSCPTQCLCSRPSWVNPVTGHYLSTKGPFLGYSTGTCCSAFWWNLRWRVFLHFRCLTASIQGRGKREGKGRRYWGEMERTL